MHAPSTTAVLLCDLSSLGLSCLKYKETGHSRAEHKGASLLINLMSPGPGLLTLNIPFLLPYYLQESKSLWQTPWRKWHFNSIHHPPPSVLAVPTKKIQPLTEWGLWALAKYCKYFHMPCFLECIWPGIWPLLCLGFPRAEEQRKHNQSSL